ncbi:thioredoxin domain-containing protein [Desulfoferrobacter suflitae]|uniref:thioredoxin domain-containing protein n=1 Tax=Desulfoferrobacter suflitae TaxID=2865782 RepID=UPI002164E01C|nr:thioredoxin domain-containing protein [Desulfoferrobacter suflitae]MCK8603765.1 thioredoxin domain-containing protein [Desulfoferrobacter suflitae]
MSLKFNRERLLLVLSLLGLGVAAVSGAAEYVPWLASMCGSFSGGCKETAEFTLFTLPLWLWGAIYYIALAVLLYWAHFLVFWWVAVAFGVELSLLWIMVSLHALCIFCLVNCLIVILIVLFSFKRERLWQTIAVSLLAFILATYIIPRENQSLAMEPDRQSEKIVAMVKGRPITAAELVQPLASELYQLQMQIFAKKKERLDRIITERLLEEEAKRRGVTIQQLVRESVPPQQVSVTEEEVEQYYQANQDKWLDWKDSQAELKARIRAYLQSEEYKQKVVEFSRSLAEPQDVVVYLQEPAAPLAHLNVQGAFSLGPANAPVTVIEFSDYLCPACRKAHEVTGKVKELYKGRIQWVFKDLPLRMHKWAEKAAEAARCAGEQGKFWEYQDVLFASQEELNPNRLKQHAAELSLQTSQFDECLDSGKYKSAVETDVETARKAGINSTPTFVINGVPSSGALSLENFQDLIDAALKKAGDHNRKDRDWKREAKE